jgi:hypothetical protein
MRDWTQGTIDIVQCSPRATSQRMFDNGPGRSHPPDYMPHSRWMHIYQLRDICQTGDLVHPMHYSHLIRSLLSQPSLKSSLIYRHIPASLEGTNRSAS